MISFLAGKIHNYPLYAEHYKIFIGIFILNEKKTSMVKTGCLFIYLLLALSIAVKYKPLPNGCAYVRLKFQGFHAFHACALHILT